MNKDFVRPLILLICTILVLGVIAQLIPGCEKGKFKLKPFQWFGHLKSIGEADSTSAAVVKAAQIDSHLLPLEPFWDKLAELKNGGSVRIAYFGDSIIEGDLITARLRYNLQNTYGGKGVGLVPITSITAGFRQTIRHSFAPNFETVSLMSKGGSAAPGFGAYVFIPRNYYIVDKAIETKVEADTTAIVDSSATPPTAPEPKPEPKHEPAKTKTRLYVDTAPWVEYSAVSIPGGADSFQHIRLFYSNASSSSTVSVSMDGKASTQHRLSAGNGVQTLDLTPSSPVSRIRLTFNALDPLHLYGVSFDKPTGVYVDNISVRGYSGMYFNAIPEDNIRAFQRAMDYDLIILQYGENVSNPGTTDYGFYHKGMIKTVNYLRQALPGVPILLISAHDRSVRKGSDYVTSPDIPILVTTQAKIASDTKSAFWNLLDAMGGLNSMRTWVQSNPPLASKDFTHFNRAGADKIGDKLTQVLTKGK